MQTPTSHGQNYRAFLLRCWVESAKEEKDVWRFSLEPVRGGRRLGFSDLETLVDFLKGDINRREEEIEP
jgi:hypothetical protein